MTILINFADPGHIAALCAVFLALAFAYLICGALMPPALEGCAPNGFCLFLAYAPVVLLVIVAMIFIVSGIWNLRA